MAQAADLECKGAMGDPQTDVAFDCSMDFINAVRRVAVLAHDGTGRLAVSEPNLRAALPNLDAKPEASVAQTVLEMAALKGVPHTLRPEDIRATDCPFLFHRAVSSGADDGWVVIADMAHAGLATAVDANGKAHPVQLADLKGQASFDVWSVAPLDGPALSDSSVVMEGRHGKEASGVAPTPRLKTSFWPPARVMPSLILATFAINVLALSLPLATMNIFDRVISNAAFDTLWVLAIGVVLALVFDFSLRTLRASVLDAASARSDVLLQNSLFGRILGARMGARRMGVGAQVNGLRELDTVRDYFNSSAIATLGDLPFVALYLLVIWLVAGSLVAVPLIAVPVFLLTALLIQLRLRRVVEGAFLDTAHKNTVATEILTGVESVKLSGGERWAAGRWERAVASQLRHSLAVRFWTNLSLHLITFFQGAVAISLLVVGVYAVTAGDLTPGALFAANLLASRCLAPLVAVSALVARWTQVRMARDLVDELSSMESERPDGRQLVQPAQTLRKLQLSDVSFSYSPDLPPVLHGVSLSITQGERIAIIGGIGSGKSTLLRLLSGLEMPTSGRVLADGLSSRDLDLDAWRRLIGVAPQSPAYFAGTVREAVAMGRVADDAAISAALKIAGADAWLSGTGLGLDTPIGERGLGFSGGQLQMLAIARAVLGEPKILLLDEPTSHMDGRSEAAFAERLMKLPSRPTRLVVTHRPAMIRACDRLIVMEAGRVAMDGPRADVLRRLREAVDQRRGPAAALEVA
ncbi:MAG: ATP-binding cassette domain-containing protein [Pseudomonadota bacterium]